MDEKLALLVHVFRFGSIVETPFVYDLHLDFFLML